jgi:alkylation response protein AidB-like acyl-CoA dehydrogenase
MNMSLDTEALLRQPPARTRFLVRDFAHYPVAPLLRRADPDLYRQCVEAQQRVRAFTDAHVRPHLAQWDQQAGRNHGFVPWQAIDAGLPEGLFSMGVPALFGGRNYGPVPIGVIAEELAAADAGLFVVYGAHALAWMLLVTSLDLRLVRRIGREISDGEKSGNPVVLALAHTEVTGGSDVEDVDDIYKAQLPSRWRKVPGGYRVTARKVFCSNGGIARYLVLTAYGDAKQPLETMRSFVIPTDAPGLTIGRPERKMGQRLCMANEIACDDLFVPDSDAVQGADAARALDTTLILTRGPVGAMGAGIMRGALERTLDYLAQQADAGNRLIDEQWVQLALADMIGALQSARGLYLNAALASDEWGFSQFMRRMPAGLPDVLTRNRLLERVTDSHRLDDLVRRRYAAQVPTAQVQMLTAHSSVAKFMGTDLSVAMCMKAMEILGPDANDPRWGVEKCLRDAKLGQIFEGTNQINRLHVTRGLLA